MTNPAAKNYNSLKICGRLGWGDKDGLAPAPRRDRGIRRLAPARAARDRWAAQCSIGPRPAVSIRDAPANLGDGKAEMTDPAAYHAWYATPSGAWIAGRELALLDELLRPHPGESRSAAPAQPAVPLEARARGLSRGPLGPLGRGPGLGRGSDAAPRALGPLCPVPAERWISRAARRIPDAPAGSARGLPRRLPATVLTLDEHPYAQHRHPSTWRPWGWSGRASTSSSPTASSTSPRTRTWCCALSCGCSSLAASCISRMSTPTAACPP